MLALLASGTGAPELPPNFQRTYNQAASDVRRHILNRSRYDRVVPPQSQRSDNTSAAGTIVQMQIRFFKVDRVSMSDGSASIKIWLRMTWQDDSLSWNPADFSGVTSVFAVADQTEERNNEIWLPDIQPYNAKVGLVHSLDPALATISSTGSVYYSRPGMLSLLCKFSGLVAFPRDSLRCETEFGGWLMGGGHQGIEVLDGGFAFDRIEDVSGTAVTLGTTVSRRPRPRPQHTFHRWSHAFSHHK